ncbi:hypothetical protein UVI_02059920 [Ustilaginoidea virens]|uniref:SPX domain-containing protein n=1 Tax=Ustilaginoidea virens TaxID=1159556 RepID=A0A1B5L3N6_USTVR|nr:hypothetical protein UVI_02059920 [Ustilaginoidea virens]
MPEHLGSRIQRLAAASCGGGGGGCSTTSFKRQRRITKYQGELVRCGEEIQALSRFANAQVVAFRKILKKYKPTKNKVPPLPQKWTGSTTLTSRFNENVLSHPRSFTKRTFSHLQSRHDGLLPSLLAATSQLSEPSSPETNAPAPQELPGPRRPRQANYQPLPLAGMDSQVKYWNEYDDGSEVGGPEDDYAIYIDPDQDGGFPGLAYMNAMLSAPYEKAKQWFKTRQPSREHGPLLASEQGSSLGYASTAVDSEEEGYSSSDGCNARLGYATYYALPSIGEQKVQRYRERVLTWATLGSFVVSFALLGVSSVLLLTGRHKLHVEVDAGVTVGVVASLFCAGSALGMTLYRRDALTLTYNFVVWSAFVASCILNGMLLVLVLGNEA